MADQNVASWKLGRLTSAQTGRKPVDTTEMLYNARNAYENRLSILDNYVNKLNQQKQTGQITDLEYINAFKSAIQRRKERGGAQIQYTKPELQETQFKAEEGVAKKTYEDIVASQKRQMQKTYDEAEVKWARVKDDYKHKRIDKKAYELQRDAYYRMLAEKATFVPPEYSFETFRPGAKLNMYRSGRMRNIGREKYIQKVFKQVWGNKKNIGGSRLHEYAGSYIPTSALRKIFEQQKHAGIKPWDSRLDWRLRSYAGSRNPGNLDYNFGGTGGRGQKPGEKYYNVKRYG